MKEIITNKILIINQFLLPNELIDIIKEYVFYNIIEKVKKRKNEIISLFNSKNFYYGKCEIPEYPDCPYPVLCMYDTRTDIKWNLWLTYCEICGKYVRKERLITYINENLHCAC
jgi:hypothetical protein